MITSVLVGLVVRGSLIVLCRRSPFFGVFGVLVQAVSFSGILCLFGRPLFGLIVVLVYVGGMLIIFLFSTVLRAERYPDSGWVDTLGASVVFLFLLMPYVKTWSRGSTYDFCGITVSREEILGEVFNRFRVVRILVVYILLVALFIVLSFGFEHSNANLRKL